MKIYLVGDDDYDGIKILGIYSSKEKAIEALPYFNLNEEDIEEFEVDPPNEGEKYERFYRYNIFNNGNEDGFWIDLRPSETKPISYGELNDKYFSQYSGVARTEEEAKLNAYKARDEAHPVWQISNNGVEIHHAHPMNINKWQNFKRSQPIFYAVHEDRNVCIIAIEEYKKTGKISEFLTFPPE